MRNSCCSEFTDVEHHHVSFPRGHAGARCLKHLGHETWAWLKQMLQAPLYLIHKDAAIPMGHPAATVDMREWRQAYRYSLILSPSIGWPLIKAKPRPEEVAECEGCCHPGHTLCQLKLVFISKLTDCFLIVFSCLFSHLRWLYKSWESRFLKDYSTGLRLYI